MAAHCWAHIAVAVTSATCWRMQAQWFMIAGVTRRAGRPFWEMVGLVAHYLRGAGESVVCCKLEGMDG